MWHKVVNRWNHTDTNTAWCKLRQVVYCAVLLNDYVQVQKGLGTQGVGLCYEGTCVAKLDHNDDLILFKINEVTRPSSTAGNSNVGSVAVVPSIAKSAVSLLPMLGDQLYKQCLIQLGSYGMKFEDWECKLRRNVLLAARSQNLQSRFRVTKTGPVLCFLCGNISRLLQAFPTNVGTGILRGNLHGTVYKGT